MRSRRMRLSGVYAKGKGPMTEKIVTEGCLRPDSKVCLHVQKDHIKNPTGMTAYYCMGCFAEQRGIFGPFCHAFNPAVLTEAGWMESQ